MVFIKQLTNTVCALSILIHRKPNFVSNQTKNINNIIYQTIKSKVLHLSK